MFLETKNPNPGVTVEADPFSLDAPIAWLEKQPGDMTYCYVSDGECLWGRYTTANGGVRNIGERGYMIGDAKLRNDFEFRWNDPRYEIARTEPWNYGAALQRARALLSERR